MKIVMIGLSTLVASSLLFVSGCELFEDDRDDESGQLSAAWIRIEGGRYEMGDELLAAAEPVHEIELPSFEMKRTEVTLNEYAACVNAGACTVPTSQNGSCNWNTNGSGELPVNCVVWEQAVQYCQWAGGRLPSESEWEYAASSGGIEDKYPWGKASPSCDYTIMKDESGIDGCGRERTWPVCSRPYGNTGDGLCDMGGNVSEWVQDHFHLDYNGSPPSDGTAWEEIGLPYRVVRGASYNASNFSFFDVSNRGNSDAASIQDNIGIRCARDVANPEF